MNKTVFESKRLLVAELNPTNKDHFIELLSDPEIIELVPQPKWPVKKVLTAFKDAMKYSPDPITEKRVFWGVYLKSRPELIGLCFFLTNDENNRELGYRFRKKYWGQGFASETLDAAIQFCFEQLDLELITADAWVKNLPSIRILEKFMNPVKEFINPEDGCIDRRYELTKVEWKKNKFLV